MTRRRLPRCLHPLLEMPLTLLPGPGAPSENSNYPAWAAAVSEQSGGTVSASSLSTRPGAAEGASLADAP